MPESFYSIRNLEDFVTKELDSQKRNIGLGAPGRIVNGVSDPLKSPLYSWIKVTSFSTVTYKGTRKRGFVLWSDSDFSETYGTTNKPGVLGYDITGEAHRINSNFSVTLYHPPPGVVDMSTEFMGGDGGKFRTLSFNWVCHDKFQLEYMAPYFIMPGASVLVEWGWSNFRDTPTPISLFNTGESSFDGELLKLRNEIRPIIERVKKSNGRYDAFMGVLTNFDYKINDNGGFACTTELKTVSQYIQGLSTKADQKDVSISEKEAEELEKQREAGIETLTKQLRSYAAGDSYPDKIEFFGKKIYSGDRVENISDFNRKTSNIEGLSGNITDNRHGFTIKHVEQYRDVGMSHKFGKNKASAWLSMFFIAHLLSVWRAPRWVRETISNPEENTIENYALSFDITNSYIRAHPNLKSIDGSVLLIPNAKAPAYPLKGDDITKLDTQAAFDFVNTRSGFDFIGEESNTFNSAQTALTSIPKSFSSEKKGYDLDNFGIRVNLAKIIAKKRLEEGGGSEDINDVSFPDYGIKAPKESGNDIPAGYAGRFGNLYVNVDVVVKALTENLNVKDAMFSILDQISAAAGGIWDFDIVDIEGRPSDLTIIDRGFTGVDDNGQLILLDDLKNNLYEFALTDYNSIIRGFDFGVKLSDAVAIQTLMSDNSRNTETKNDKFFQSIYTIDGEKSEYIVEPSIFQFKSASSTKKASDGKLPELYSTKADEEYYIITFGSGYGLTADGQTELFIRLVEPNADVVKFAIEDDDSPANSFQYNGAVPGIEVSLKLTGISGIGFMHCFLIRDLPYPYYPEMVFQVKQVKHSVSGGDWTTSIDAVGRPSPKFIIDSTNRAKKNG